MANSDWCNSPGRCSDDEDFTRDQEPLRSRVGNDAEDEDCCAESGNFLALFASNKGGHLGVARYDEEDCSFEVLQLPHDQDCQGLSMLLQQFHPQIVVTSSKTPDQQFSECIDRIKNQNGVQVIYLPAKNFSYNEGLIRLLEIAKKVLKKTGDDEDLELCLHSLIDTDGKEAISAAAGLMMYLENHRAGDELQQGWEPEIQNLQQIHMWQAHYHTRRLEKELQRSFDIINDDHPAGAGGGKAKEGLSLLSILDNTQSPLGRKLLRSWILRPLLKEQEIARRTEGVRFFAAPENMTLVDILRKHVRKASASVLDWQNLMNSLQALHQIRQVLENCCEMHQDELPGILAQVLAQFSEKLHNLATLIGNVVDFEESKHLKRLAVLQGVDDDLDEEKRCYEGLGDFLEDIARQEVNDLGEGSDDVRLSVVFFPQIGYLVAIPASDGPQEKELSGLMRHFSTDEYVYYKSPRMVQLDDELGDISCKISDREFSILDEVRVKLMQFTEVIIQTCHATAVLDCVLSLAVAAIDRNWVEPLLVNEPVLYIEGGRHPLCELCVDTFVPNDSIMDNARNHPLIQLLTGPNYSGKSIYLKQVGLIVYLAHLGSWVPAHSCQVGLTDRIFSRIQSRESCSVSHSSFGLDLNQVSVMLRNSTPRSLLLIDEFGKGTQSSDGVALLAATIGHLDARADKCPRTVCVTHFHELTVQRDVLPQDKNIGFYTMAVMAENGRKVDKQQNMASYHVSQDPEAELVFLYQIVEGKSMSSHGYHCAIKAGIPLDIVQRAQQVSKQLSRNEPITRIESERDRALGFRAEEMVDKFSRFDVESGNLDEFFDFVRTFGEVSKGFVP